MTIPRRRGVAVSHHTTPRAGRDARGSLCPQAPRAIVALHGWARCPLLPCCRPAPLPPRWPLSCAVSRTCHSTPSSGTRIAHSMPPNGAGVGICAAARRCRATQCYRMARRPRTRRYRVVRPSPAGPASGCHRHRDCHAREVFLRQETCGQQGEARLGSCPPSSTGPQTGRAGLSHSPLRDVTG